MHLSIVQRIIGILLLVFSLSMLPPMLVSWIYDENAIYSYVSAFIFLAGSGTLAWLPVRNESRELRLRDGFVVVVLFWTVLSISGSLPFILLEQVHMSIVDAVFESVSGLTTTGATVIVGIDELPKSLLYYRQQLQWLGGMGIIVLAVAVLPMLRIGGMQLYRAETPGPMKDSKLTPRITETAKALWYIYLSMTVLCLLAYWAAGMSFFDALGHAFSTVAIGGFSTHDASLGYFDSQWIEIIAIIFMYLAGVNFALHFVAWRERSVLGYLRDSEFRFYSLVLLGAIILVTIDLMVNGIFENSWDAFLKALFHTVSIGTTAGFSTTDHYNWPGFAAILLLFVSFVGGCAGSTGGGMKAIRILLLVKQGAREVDRLIHPNAQIPVRVGDKVISQRVIDAVWGFFALYVACFSIMYLALAFTGLDLMTSFSAVAATMNNLGPGLAGVGANYADIGDTAKWILCFAMLLGRLEIFTLLVLFSPSFWRR